jgi:hypothetical protein
MVLNMGFVPVSALVYDGARHDDQLELATTRAFRHAAAAGQWRQIMKMSRPDAVLVISEQLYPSDRADNDNHLSYHVDVIGFGDLLGTSKVLKDARRRVREATKNLDDAPTYAIDTGQEKSFREIPFPCYGSVQRWVSNGYWKLVFDHQGRISGFLLGYH